MVQFLCNVFVVYLQVFLEENGGKTIKPESSQEVWPVRNRIYLIISLKVV